MDGKFLYFFIKYKQKLKENADDIDFVIPENKNLKPESIYIEERYENPFYYYNKIFRVNKSASIGKKGNKYHFEFIINDEIYKIKFDYKGSVFVYEVCLEFGKRLLPIQRKKSHKEYYETFEYFIKALKNGEENIIDVLYKDTLNLKYKTKIILIFSFPFKKIQFFIRY